MVSANLEKNLGPSVSKLASGSFAFRNTKSCRKHALLMLKLMLVTYVPLLLIGEGKIMNDQK